MVAGSHPPKKRFQGIKAVEVKKFDEGLVAGFKSELRSKPSYVQQKIQDAAIKMQLVDGKKPIGFACGYFQGDHLTVTAVYIAPSHRRQGLLRASVYWMLGKAKKAGLAGVQLSEMVKETRGFFFRESNRIRDLSLMREKPLLHFEKIDNRKPMPSGRIEFLKRPVVMKVPPKVLARK